jgi:hypothetical protein
LKSAQGCLTTKRQDKRAPAARFASLPGYACIACLKAVKLREADYEYCLNIIRGGHAGFVPSDFLDSIPYFWKPGLARFAPALANDQYL